MKIKTTRVIYGILSVKNYEGDCCCWCSVTQSYSALCNPMNYSIPGFHVLHYFPKFAQTHVRQVGDAIQPCCSQSFPFPPAFSLSQPQVFFPQWVGSSHQVAKGLELQLQYKSSQWIFGGWFPLGLTGLIPLPTKGLPEVFSNTTAQRHQFFGTQHFLLSCTHIHTWLLEKL